VGLRGQKLSGRASDDGTAMVGGRFLGRDGRLSLSSRLSQWAFGVQRETLRSSLGSREERIEILLSLSCWKWRKMRPTIQVHTTARGRRGSQLNGEPSRHRDARVHGRSRKSSLLYAMPSDAAMYPPTGTVASHGMCGTERVCFCTKRGDARAALIMPTRLNPAPLSLV
jgi:hypothetical protein